MVNMAMSVVGFISFEDSCVCSHELVRQCVAE